MRGTAAGDPEKRLCRVTTSDRLGSKMVPSVRRSSWVQPPRRSLLHSCYAHAPANAALQLACSDDSRCGSMTVEVPIGTLQEQMVCSTSVSEPLGFAPDRRRPCATTRLVRRSKYPRGQPHTHCAAAYWVTLSARANSASGIVAYSHSRPSGLRMRCLNWAGVD